MNGAQADKLNSAEDALRDLNRKPREQWSPTDWARYENLCERWNQLQEDS